MNVMYFLIPKREVAYLRADSTLRQAMEKMEYHRYSAIPVIDKYGRYDSTLTEGDILWFVKNCPSAIENAERISIRDIPRRFVMSPIRADAKIDDLLEQILNANFVPVTDDSGIFVGIITRRAALSYLYKKTFEKSRTNIE